MDTDEVGTLFVPKNHRRELFAPTMTKRSGRLFKEMDYGFLMEFGSVVNAERRAAEIKAGIAAIDEAVPDRESVIFGIGVNRGDVIVEGTEL